MTTVNVKDLLGAALLMIIGAYVILGSFDLDLGTAQQMGPGYYPLLLGIALILLSFILTVFSLGGGTDPIQVEWRPMVMVLASMGMFVVAMRNFGLIPAVFATVVVAAGADRNAGLLSTLGLGAIASIGAWLIFRVGLGLPMPAFRGVL